MSGGTSGDQRRPGRGEEDLVRRQPQAPQRDVGPVDHPAVRDEPLPVEAPAGVADGHRCGTVLGDERERAGRVARQTVLDHRIDGVQASSLDEELPPVARRRGHQVRPPGAQRRPGTGTPPRCGRWRRPGRTRPGDRRGSAGRSSAQAERPLAPPSEGRTLPTSPMQTPPARRSQARGSTGPDVTGADGTGGGSWPASVGATSRPTTTHDARAPGRRRPCARPAASRTTQIRFRPPPPALCSDAGATVDPAGATDATDGWEAGGAPADGDPAPAGGDREAGGASTSAGRSTVVWYDRPSMFRSSEAGPAPQAGTVSRCRPVSEPDSWSMAGMRSAV